MESKSPRTLRKIFAISTVSVKRAKFVIGDHRASYREYVLDSEVATNAAAASFHVQLKGTY